MKKLNINDIHQPINQLINQSFHDSTTISLPARLGNALSPCVFDDPEKEVEREAENVLAPSGSPLEITMKIISYNNIVISVSSSHEK